MFRLIYLKLNDHQQLGDIELNFVEEGELENKEKPYTSVIIGPNGTGKSFILRTVAEIFRQFEAHQKDKKKEIDLPFHIHLRYIIGKDSYDIIAQRFISLSERGRKYIYFRNRPIDFRIYREGQSLLDADKTHKISISELKFPQRLIVNSIMINDRFTFSDSQPDDFYQYLGIRRNRSTTSTQTFSKKTIKYLFDAGKSRDFVDDLGDLLNFMGFEHFFKVHYITKYNKYFFTGELTIEQFNKFFNEWWEVTGRKRENKPWGHWFYEKLAKENPDRLIAIINYINEATKGDTLLFHKERSKSKFFELDFFNVRHTYDEFEFVEDLVKLDILNLDGIKIKKLNEFSIDQSSAGEYHLILALLGLYSKIEDSSIILIDEPEISLHPNWQMRYINFLKNMFRNYANSHFIITTHSHFLVSDLEGESSSVISLNRNSENILEADLVTKDTFGWSAEEVLYTVFGVRTTRNYYIEIEVRELLYKIAIKSSDFERMKELVENLKKVNLTINDPLSIVIKKAEEYLIND